MAKINFDFSKFIQTQNSDSYTPDIWNAGPHLAVIEKITVRETEEQHTLMVDYRNAENQTKRQWINYYDAGAEADGQEGVAKFNNLQRDIARMQGLMGACGFPQGVDDTTKLEGQTVCLILGQPKDTGRQYIDRIYPQSKYEEIQNAAGPRMTRPTFERGSAKVATPPDLGVRVHEEDAQPVPPAPAPSASANRGRKGGGLLNKQASTPEPVAETVGEELYIEDDIPFSK